MTKGPQDAKARTSYLLPHTSGTPPDHFCKGDILLLQNAVSGLAEIMEKARRKGYDYVEKNFKFTLLEIHPMFTSDETIILRESFWKEVMMSRNKKFGYNSN